MNTRSNRKLESYRFYWHKLFLLSLSLLSACLSVYKGILVPVRTSFSLHRRSSKEQDVSMWGWCGYVERHKNALDFSLQRSTYPHQPHIDTSCCLSVHLQFVLSNIMTDWYWPTACKDVAGFLLSLQISKGAKVQNYNINVDANNTSVKLTTQIYDC